jgi:N,N'-diacetyllegionaminate synthase
MSTGYCTLEEIDRAVKIVEEAGNEKLALLHCISEYPAKPRDVNLEFIQTLKQAYNIPVGFSDHTLGWKVTLAAVAKGADIIEKHITLSRDSDGPDHYFAVEPPELEEMIKDIRTVEESFGTGRKLRITRDEANSLSKIRMRAVAKRDFSAGEIIDKEKDVAFRRTRTGIDAWEIYRADKLILGKNIKKGEALTYEYLEIERKSD